MTEPLDLSPGEEADALAAEFVLGVLSLQDRLAAEARIKSDADFASRVAKWEAHFDAFNDGYESLPAPDLMPTIEARLFGLKELPKRGWWQFFAGAGAAAALALAVVTIAPSFSPDRPTLTASLAADAQVLAFNASYADGKLTLERLAGPEAGAGRDYQLWVIVGDAAPVSLGLIDSATSTRDYAALAPGAVLAISLEPTGGSTTGAPTGPVLVTGVIAAS
jgi:anti-sigma-K factor RskA